MKLIVGKRKEDCFSGDSKESVCFLALTVSATLLSRPLVKG